MAQSSNRPPAWLNETFVWGQVNINEQDPATFDVGWWSNYWSACGLQGVTLNVGGSLAYYPTEVPLHRRSPFLGERDLLGECVDAAKRLGLRVMGRLDPAFTTREVHEAHPDWCVTAPNGLPHSLESLFAAYAGRVLDPALSETSTFLACSYSPYFDEFVLPVVTEVLQRYPLDGIWTNAWPSGLGTSSTFCHCPHCTAAWEHSYPGRARPSKADASDRDWRDHLVFGATRVEDLQRKLRGHVHRAKPGAALITSGVTTPETTFRWGRLIEHSDALGIDAQGRSLFITEPARRTVLWSVGLQSELSRAVANGRPVLRFIATYSAEERAARHVARPSPETRLQMAQALAHGERPKWHTVGGTAHDRRWMSGVQEMDQWMAERIDWLRDLRPVSDVGVVWSPRSIHLANWSGRPGPSHRDALVGWYAALMQRRIPFEYVHEDHLASLDRFRVLVLPTALCLSEDAVEAIRAYSARGGAMVACCDALRADEWGVPREPDSVSRLLGVEYGEQLLGPLSHSCISLDESRIFEGLRDTDIITGGRWIRQMSPVEGASTDLHGAWIPDYPVTPTQDVVLPDPRRDVPLSSLLLNDGGASAVCIAADLDAAFGRHEDEDHAQVLTNAVMSGLGDRGPTVEVSGAGLVDVRPWRQDERVLVFLVNLDNVRTHGGAVGELRPLGPVEVRITLAEGEIAGQVSLLRRSDACVWGQKRDQLRVTVKVVEDFELLVVDLV